jgi:hypothetical protein
MDNGDVQELHRVMCHHKDLIHANHSTLLTISSKITEIEQVCTTQTANIMSILVHQKQRLDSLEAECNRLQSLTLTQHGLFINGIQ